MAAILVNAGLVEQHHPADRIASRRKHRRHKGSPAPAESSDDRDGDDVEERHKETKESVREKVRAACTLVRCFSQFPTDSRRVDAVHLQHKAELQHYVSAAWRAGRAADKAHKKSVQPSRRKALL